jgi:hypothetical protein
LRSVELAVTELMSARIIRVLLPVLLVILTLLLAGSESLSLLLLSFGLGVFLLLSSATL